MDPAKTLYHCINGANVKASELVHYTSFVSFSESNVIATSFAKGQGGTVYNEKAVCTVLIIENDD